MCQLHRGYTEQESTAARHQKLQFCNRVLFSSCTHSLIRKCSISHLNARQHADAAGSEQRAATKRRDDAISDFEPPTSSLNDERAPTNVESFTTNREHRTSNLEPRTSNLETSNCELRIQTTNHQPPTTNHQPKTHDDQLRTLNDQRPSLKKKDSSQRIVDSSTVHSSTVRPSTANVVASSLHCCIVVATARLASTATHCHPLNT